MDSLRIVGGRLLRGCSAGLAEPTAIGEVDYDWTRPVDPAADARIRAGIAALCPEQPLFGIGESDWPAAFLVEAPQRDASPGRWLGEWIVALTVAMQRWASQPVWRGRVVDAGADRLTLAIPWYDEGSFRRIHPIAVGLIEQWCRPEPQAADLVDSFRRELPALRTMGLSPNTFRYIQAAVDRDIPFHVLPNCVQLGWGADAERFEGSFTGHTGVIAAGMTHKPIVVYRTIATAGVPVPNGRLAGDMDTVMQVAGELGWPLVVKPVNANHGPAVTGITDADALRNAVETVTREGASAVLVEQHVAGDDHRILVVNGLVTAVARRNPPADVTADLHPDNRKVVARAARLVGLDVAGVDFITPDIGRSWRDVGGVVRAVCGQPDLSPHWRADPGRDVNGEVLDIVFGDRPLRIPTAAITGTNGKSTTALMLQRIWTAAGRRTGVCTTAGLRIGDEVITTTNLSGYPGAMLLLSDPGVEAAVIELPRRGLMVYGNPCDRYDVAAFLNVQDDHIGVDGIETMEQLAEVKAEALERAAHAVVVNADDPLCMAMLPRAGTDRHILVTRDPDSVAAHRRGGGEAVLIAEHDGRPWIMLCAGETQTPLMPVADIPATMDGLLRFNADNAMFAAALAWAQGIDAGVIRAALASFDNSIRQNPGRYNFVDGLPYRLLVDYAHNPDGIREICRVAAALPVTGRRLLCSLNIGSRHKHHIAAVAPALAAAFDEIVVGCDREEVAESPDHTGDDPVTAMLDGFAEHLRANGVAPESITTSAEDQQAVMYATVERARPGDLVVVVAEPPDALPFIAGLTGRGV